MAANIGEVQGHGDSAAWKAQKSNVLRIFEEFRVRLAIVMDLKLRSRFFTLQAKRYGVYASL